MYVCDIQYKPVSSLYFYFLKPPQIIVQPRIHQTIYSDIGHSMTPHFKFTTFVHSDNILNKILPLNGSNQFLDKAKYFGRFFKFPSRKIIRFVPILTFFEMKLFQLVFSRL